MSNFATDQTVTNLQVDLNKIQRVKIKKTKGVCIRISIFLPINL